MRDGGCVTAIGEAPPWSRLAELVVPSRLGRSFRFLNSSIPHPEVFFAPARHAVTNVCGQYT